MAMNTASTDASADATPFTPHAQGTPLGCNALNRRRPMGMAMPRVSPNGARRAMVTSTLAVKGRPIKLRNSGWSENALMKISAATTTRSTDSAPTRFLPAARKMRSDPREDENCEQDDGERVGRKPEEQHESLDEHDLQHEVAQPDRDEDQLGEWRAMRISRHVERNDECERGERRRG